MIPRTYALIAGLGVASGGAAFAWNQRASKPVPACCLPGNASAATPAKPVVSSASAPEPLAAGGPNKVAVALVPEGPAAEGDLMRGLRATKDPAKRLSLAREGNTRFPAGADASERTAIIVEALFALDRAPEGRTEASTFLEAHPDDPWAKQIRSFTGLHTH